MNSFMRQLGHIGLHRPRLLAAMAVGAAVFAALPAYWTLTSRGLVAWNMALWPYLASMAWLMLRSSPEKVRAIAEQEDASSGAVVAVVSGAAVLSLVAIVAQLAHAQTAGPAALAYGLPAVTVVGSWVLLGAIYTFHYAHMFYQSPETARALRFPEGLDSPTYHDFLYFSFTIAAAVQTSDVTVMSTPMRAVVVTQSVLGFFFNVAILGLSINIAAGLVGRG